MMNNKWNIAKNMDNLSSVAALNFLSVILLNGINFFTIPIFTRMLGPENYGVFSIYTAWVSLFTIFIGLRVDFTISTARIKFEKEEQPKYFSSVLSLALLSFFVFLLAFLLLKNVLPNIFGLPFLIYFIIPFHAFGTFCTNFACIKFINYKQPFLNILYSLILITFNVFISILLINLIKDQSKLYIGRVFGSSIPSMLVGMITFVWFMMKGKCLFSKQYWGYGLRLSIPVIFGSVFGLILNQSDKIMLQHLTNNSLVGIYGFSITFASVVSIIGNSLRQSWMPFYFDDLKSNNFTRIREKSRNLLHLFITISLGFILLSPEVIKLFSSNQFWDAVLYVPCIVFGLLIYFLMDFLAEFEIFYHKNYLGVIGTVISGCINVLINAVLIPLYGIAAALFSSIVAYLFAFFFHIFVVKKNISAPFPLSITWMVKNLLYMAAFVVGFYLIKDFLILRWMLAICLGIYQLSIVIKRKALF